MGRAWSVARSMSDGEDELLPIYWANSSTTPMIGLDQT